MPLADTPACLTLHGEQPYRCPNCQHEAILRAAWAPVAPEHREYSWQTEQKIDPTCPYCGVAMVWIPAPTQSHDLLPDGFVIPDVDGKGERRISSVSELRTLERESEQRHRNGDGQILNFRTFSQDHGNRHTNSLSGSSYEKGKSRRPERQRTQSNLPISVRTHQG